MMTAWKGAGAAGADALMAALDDLHWKCINGWPLLQLEASLKQHLST
jgi:hypothetical protein